MVRLVHFRVMRQHGTEFHHLKTGLCRSKRLQLFKICQASMIDNCLKTVLCHPWLVNLSSLSPSQVVRKPRKSTLSNHYRSLTIAAKSCPATRKNQQQYRRPKLPCSTGSHRIRSSSKCSKLANRNTRTNDYDQRTKTKQWTSTIEAVNLLTLLGIQLQITDPTRPTCLRPPASAYTRRQTTTFGTIVWEALGW